MADDTRTTGSRGIEPDAAALALAAADMGVYEWNLLTDTMNVSPAMARITGLPAGPLKAEGGMAILRHIHAEDVEMVAQTAVAGRASRERYEFRYRVVRPDDGRMVWLYTAAIAVGPPDAPTERVIGVVQDITSQKAQEAEREALVRELDHRVKNVLAAVQSLAAQSARKTVSLDSFLKTFAGRLEAMASAH